jgi:hypothetical protein
VERSQLSRVARELFHVDLPPGPFVFEGRPEGLHYSST